MGGCQRVAFDKLRLSGPFMQLQTPDPLMLSLSKHMRCPDLGFPGSNR